MIQSFLKPLLGMWIGSYWLADLSAHILLLLLFSWLGFVCELVEGLVNFFGANFLEVFLSSVFFVPVMLELPVFVFLLVALVFAKVHHTHDLPLRSLVCNCD